MNDEKSFPYWSPKSSKAVIARHWAGYLVFLMMPSVSKKFLFMQNAVFDFMQKFMKKYLSF
jgi:hypothetical protein